MKPVSIEVIRSAIDILGTPDLSEDEIESRVGSLASSPMEARRLIDWIPEAFGSVLSSHHKVVLAKAFYAKDSRGEWIAFPFVAEPIFVTVVPIAQSVFHNGPRQQFEVISNRSAAAHSLSNVLNAGGSLEGAVSRGPSLLGIPAEVYQSAELRCGRKLMTVFLRGCFALTKPFRRLRNRLTQRPPGS